MVNSVSGLCWLHRSSNLYQPLPLHSVRVDATLYDLCAEVKVQQTYVNLQDSSQAAGDPHAAGAGPLECVYIFPLDEESAVFSFVAELDGVIVKGRIREKVEARAEYNSAIAHNRSAMLLEQSSDNIFQCAIGNLHPGSICTITLTYLTLLDQQGRHNRLTLPMVIAPKYIPAIPGPTPPFPPSHPPPPHNAIHSGYHCHHCLCSPIIGPRHHCHTCSYDLCHGCHMQHDMTHPMLTFTGQPPPITHPSILPSPAYPTTLQGKLGDLTINLTVTMPSRILSIQCPSHPDETKIQHDADPSNHATASFHSVSTCSLSKDFILLVEQQRCFEPRVLCELDMTNRTAALSLVFIPPPLDMLSASQMRCELIFLVDCSGSMRGSSITCVRECMHLLLRSLPVHSRFNILIFGSSWSSLFPISQAYDDTSLPAASQYVSKLQANLGGTEIYPPLHHALTSNLLPTHPRQIFLLTDGQVSNVKQLAQLTSQHAVNTRLFTFGIGGSVDRLLCKKLAQAGRGKFEFVTADNGGGADMREKVVRQVARAMQPMLTDVNVDWGQLKGPIAGSKTNQEGGFNNNSESPPSSNSPFLQCPSVAPAIFMSSRYVLHALNVCLPETVWQQAQAGQKLELKCDIDITAHSNHPHEVDHMHRAVVLTGDQITQAGVIHTLAARERIRELEDQLISIEGEVRHELEDEILQLAMKHTLTSSRTSFVVVYNNGKDTETEEMAFLCQSGEEHGMLPSSTLSLKRMPMGNAMSHRCRASQLRGQVTVNSYKGFKGVAKPGGASGMAQEVARGEILESMQLQSYRCRALVASLRSTESAQKTGLQMRRKMELAQPGGASGMPQEVARGEILESMQLQSSDGDVTTGLLMALKDAEPTFQDLIQLQSANGVWHITPMLIGIVHAMVPSSSSTITVQSLQAISKEHGVDQPIVGTLLALHLLETHYKHRHAEWEMLATKAQYFLTEHAKISAQMQQEIKGNIMNKLSRTN